MLTRKVKLAIGCILLILFAIGMFNFLRYMNTKGQRKEFSRKFGAEVERKWNSDNPAQIRLKDLTDFVWDRVHIFTPYRATETIDKDLGYAWQPARSIGMYQRDDINLLVFTNIGKVVFYVDLPRYSGDLDGNYKQGGYSPDEAIFKVVQRGKLANGLPYLLLEWQERTP